MGVRLREIKDVVLGGLEDPGRPFDSSIALRFDKVVSALDVTAKQTANENRKLKNVLGAELIAKRQAVAEYAAANCDWEYDNYVKVRQEVASITQTITEAVSQHDHVTLLNKESSVRRDKLIRGGAFRRDEVALSPPPKKRRWGWF